MRFTSACRDWEGEAAADAQNRALIDAYDAAHPEWREIANALSVRTEMPADGELFGTVLDRGAGYAEPPAPAPRAAASERGLSICFFSSFLTILPLALRGSVSGQKITSTGTLNAASFCATWWRSSSLGRAHAGLQMHDGERLFAERAGAACR